LRLQIAWRSDYLSSTIDACTDHLLKVPRINIYWHPSARSRLFCTIAPELFLLFNGQRTMLCLKCLFNYLVSSAINLRLRYHRRQAHFFFPYPAQPPAYSSILKGSAKEREEHTTRFLRFPCRVRDGAAAAAVAAVVGWARLPHPAIFLPYKRLYSRLARSLRYEERSRLVT
jgi:hypothetical protein